MISIIIVNIFKHEVVKRGTNEKGHSSILGIEGIDFLLGKLGNAGIRKRAACKGCDKMEFPGSSLKTELL